MTTVAHRDNESGMALITTLMVLMLMSALMVGFFAAITTDQRANGIDRDQTQAYAVAHAGLEKLTSDLAGLFQTDFSPNASQITALTATANQPSISGFQYTDPLVGTAGSGYAIVTGTLENRTISSGPYQGFKGLITPYALTVTARSNGGGAEVRLRRQLETVSVPVFQFGMFSETDLSFFAGPAFNFGGRVHTNGNLYLAEGSGNILTLADRVTAAGEIIRRELSNGFTSRTNTSYTGTVQAITAPGVFRNLGLDEGSVKDAMGAPVSTYVYAQNEPAWTNLSVGTYKSNIRSSRTGGKRLDLPLVSQGAMPIDLIRRPAQNSNENTTNPLVYGQRYFGMLDSSLRILLSDTAADITSLPTVNGATAPLPLDTVVGGGYVVDATHPPLAVSAAQAATTTTAANTLAGAPIIIVTGLAGFNVGVAQVNNFFLNGYPVRCTGTTTVAPWNFTGCVWTAPGTQAGGATIDTGYRSAAGTGLNGGVIKIERHNVDGSWTDVTLEILNLGFTGKNIFAANCVDPTPLVAGVPTAIVKIQRLRDRPSTATVPAPCGTITAASLATDFWPNALYDTREGNLRDANAAASTTMSLGGIINYVELDVNNLKRWFAGTIGATGNLAVSNNGYIVYFSDRRNNRNAANLETGEYGNEDVVNPADINGAPTGLLEAGEDVNNFVCPVPVVPGCVNGPNVLDTYGTVAGYLVGGARTVPAGAGAPFTAAALPTTTAGVTAAVARVNRILHFRRALKLVNAGIVGGVSSLPSPGLTVAAENPVYVQGNFNATAINANANPHMAAAILADSVTVLSNSWNDLNSFNSPNNPTVRPGSETGYRMAIAAGKTLSFKRPTWNGVANDFGTDGGAHNFLRFIEDWNANLNYRGSIVSLFISRQAVGTYKCCTNVYGPPTRVYTFDTDFLTPSLLPPGTPMFRDIDTLTFRQLLRPTE